MYPLLSAHSFNCSSVKTSSGLTFSPRTCATISSQSTPLSISSISGLSTTTVDLLRYAEIRTSSLDTMLIVFVADIGGCFYYLYYQALLSFSFFYFCILNDVIIKHVLSIRVAFR